MKHAVIYTALRQYITSLPSLEKQETALREYAEQNDILIHGHFQDTEPKAVFDRPGFKNMLELFRTYPKRVDAVLFLNWSVFTNDPCTGIEIVETLSGLQVDAWSAWDLKRSSGSVELF